LRLHDVDFKGRFALPFDFDQAWPIGSGHVYPSTALTLTRDELATAGGPHPG
jgi:hypothetical protein